MTVEVMSSKSQPDFGAGGAFTDAVGGNTDEIIGVRKVSRTHTAKERISFDPRAAEGAHDGVPQGGRAEARGARITRARRRLDDYYTCRRHPRCSRTLPPPGSHADGSHQRATT